MQPTVHTQIENSIAKIQFYNPASNACDPSMLAQMVHAFNTLSANSQVKVILLSSKGNKAFCAGASITHLSELKDMKAATDFFSGFGRLILSMKNCNKIIVTSVQGKAVGGGVGIIAASDYVIATENSGLRLSELMIGIGPLVIAPAVIRKVGVAHFSQLSLKPSTWKDAKWGAAHGLFNELVTDGDSLENVTVDYCNSLASYSAQALSALKSVLWQGTEHWEELLYENAAKTATLSLSEDAQESFKKFNS